MGMFSSSPVTEKAGRLSPTADSSLTMVTPNTVIRPLNCLVSFCCLTSREARRPVRDGDEWDEKAYQGRGRVGKGGQKSETSRQSPTRKTKAAVDRRQNNRMLRQCPSGIALRPQHHAVAVPTAMQNRVTQSAVGKQLKQKKPNSLSLSSPAPPPCS